MSRTTTAFVKLAELASVCRKHARALPSSEKTQSVWTGIGISLHHAYYVCPLNEVAEILKVPPYLLIKCKAVVECWYWSRVRCTAA
ncbi:MAG: hypothetical protein P8176_01975 [Gammaproteobacteria bacterium]